ncbi:MAG: hypothetical protein K9K66_18220 [Desulfarculaceae bacterium]|nr:hypothetical protein [Desulfarculaceae bacterium]MCF8074498.1 hypothetical protein [Desulfarculaceae bacterium]MCF8103597.1 hypothetical protein [Desulfarculaceae bacterium]MCF8118387.1 hypothetical protein [Desulfarculaceae bacterium]
MSAIRSKMKMRGVAICLVAALVLLGAGSLWAAPQPKAGGEIKVRLNTDITSVDPLASPAMVNAVVLNHVFEPLLAYTTNLKIVPVVAQSWEASKDYKTYTFHLIKGKKFHNGAELTSEDVKFSVERMMNPKTCARAKLFTGVAKVEAVDKYTVRILMKKSSPGFPNSLAYVAPVMAIMCKAEVEKQGGQITHPVGTGPFKFMEWKPDRHVILEKFAGYKGQSGARDGMGGERVAYLDKVTFLPISEESVAVMALVNKEVDLVHSFPQKYMKKYKSDYSKQGMVVQEVAGLVWVGAHFGVTRPVVDNLKFRQACAYALSIKSMAKAAFMGYATINPSAIATANQYYTPYFKEWYAPDMAKAKQLLKESGYKGQEVVVDTTKKYSYMYRMAVAVHAQLKALGVNAKLNVIDWPVLLKKHLKGQSQIHTFGAAPMPDPALAYAYLKRNKFMEVYPEAEKLRQEAMATADFKVRQKIFEKIHKICIEQVPWVISCNYNYLNAFRDYVHGYQVLSTGMPRLWGVWLSK